MTEKFESTWPEATDRQNSHRHRATLDLVNRHTNHVPKPGSQVWCELYEGGFDILRSSQGPRIYLEQKYGSISVTMQITDLTLS